MKHLQQFVPVTSPAATAHPEGCEDSEEEGKASEGDSPAFHEQSQVVRSPPETLREQQRGQGGDERGERGT